MSLLLTLVQAPHPQPVRQMRLEDGELVIGRSAEADWRIDDPDMFVSRAHCTVAGRGGALHRHRHLERRALPRRGAARRSAPATRRRSRDGMRLRLGDYVVRVELQADGAPPPPSRRRRRRAGGGRFDADDFFATPAAARAAPPSARPTCPTRSSGRARSRAAQRRPSGAAPPAFDDPFTLDPPPGRAAERAAAAGGFDWDTPAAAGAARRAPRDPRAAAAGGARLGRAGADREPAAAPRRRGPSRDRRRPARRPEAALAAFLRGLGLDPADAPAGDPLARLEAFGREYRLMAEGLMHLLRMRAEEKGNARIAQTVVGAARGQPAEVHADGRGRARGDARAAQRRLRRRRGARSPARCATSPQHHVSAWRGIQAALRRMVDRFDPKALEARARGARPARDAARRRPPRQALGALREAVTARSPRAPRRASWARSARTSATPTRPRRSEPCPTDAPSSPPTGAAGLLAACGGGRPAPATVAVDRRPARPGMNPGPDGADRPVTVSLLRLRDVGAFNAADLFALQDPATALAADLVGMDQLAVAPGRQRREDASPSSPRRRISALVALAARPGRQGLARGGAGRRRAAPSPPTSRSGPAAWRCRRRDAGARA